MMEIQKRTEESNVFVVLSQAWNYLIKASRQTLTHQINRQRFKWCGNLHGSWILVSHSQAFFNFFSSNRCSAPRASCLLNFVLSFDADDDRGKIKNQAKNTIAN